MKFVQRRAYHQPNRGGAGRGAEEEIPAAGSCDNNHRDRFDAVVPSDRSPMCLLPLPLRLGIIPGKKRRKDKGQKTTNSNMSAELDGGREATTTARNNSASSSSRSSSVPSAIAHLQALREESAQAKMNPELNEDVDAYQWDWKALEEELNRRETSSTTRDDDNGDEPRIDEPPIDDEEDDILVTIVDHHPTTKSSSVHPPSLTSLDAENASIDAVIRKVARLRAPLRYDEPELTPVDVQQRWLHAAVGAIEFEKRREQNQKGKQQQQYQHPTIRINTTNDDAPQDPDPGSEEGRFIHNGRGDSVPTVSEPRSGREPAPAEGRDDDEAEEGTSSRRRSVRKRQDPSPLRDALKSRNHESREVIGVAPTHSKADAEISPPDNSRYQAPLGHETTNGNDALAAESIDSHDEIVLLDEDERDGPDEVESARHEEPKQSDYVYLQIEKRNTSGDDDVSVSSMEYLFNWLTCVNVDEELQHKRRLVDPSKTSKGKKNKVASNPEQADATATRAPKKPKDKQVKAAPTGSAPPHRSPSSTSPKKTRFNADAAVGSRDQGSPVRRRRLVDPQQQQQQELHGLNYRPSRNHSSGTVSALSTTERITNIIDRTDAWLQIGLVKATNAKYDNVDDFEDLDEEGMGEEVQLSPKRKPTLQVPRDEVVRYHPTLSGREPSTVGKPQRTKGKRMSMRSRQDKSGTFH